LLDHIIRQAFNLDGDASRAKQQRDFVRAAAELGFTLRRVGNV
jgi:hypothetical protein